MLILGQLATNERFFRAPAEFIEAIARELPQGTEFVPCESVEEFRARLPDATGVVGWPFASAWLRRAPKLRFVHLLTAGIPEGFDSAASAIRLSSSAGTNAQSVAEHALLLVLAAARGVSLVGLTRWDAEAFRPARRLDSLRVLVVGYGGIGASLVSLLTPLVADVRVVSRTARVEGSRTIDGFESLPGHAAAADVVVLALPNRPSTRALFESAFFASLRDDVALINVARGGLVDEAAVIRFLDAHVGARYLADVAVPEPYPDDGPLRRHPSVLLTPHVGGRALDVWDSLTTCTLAELRLALRATESAS